MFDARAVEELFGQTTRSLQRSRLLLDERCSAWTHVSHGRVSSSAQHAAKPSYATPVSMHTSSNNVNISFNAATTTTCSSSSSNTDDVYDEELECAFAEIFAQGLHELRALARMKDYLAACVELSARTTKEAEEPSKAIALRRSRGDVYAILRRVVGGLHCPLPSTTSGASDGGGTSNSSASKELRDLWWTEGTLLSSVLSSRMTGNMQSNSCVVEGGLHVADSATNDGKDDADDDNIHNNRASSAYPVSSTATRTSVNTDSSHAWTERSTFGKPVWSDGGGGVAGVVGLLLLCAFCADTAQSVRAATASVQQSVLHVWLDNTGKQGRIRTMEECLTHVAHVPASEDTMAQATGTLHSLLSRASVSLPAEVTQSLLRNMMELLGAASPAANASSPLASLAMSEAAARSLSNSLSSPAALLAMPGVLSYTLLRSTPALVDECILEPVRAMSRALLGVYLRSLSDFQSLSYSCLALVLVATTQLLQYATQCHNRVPSSSEQRNQHSSSSSFTYASSAANGSAVAKQTPGSARKTDQKVLDSDACMDSGNACKPKEHARLAEALKRLHDALLLPITECFHAAAARPGMAHNVQSALARPYVAFARRSVAHLEYSCIHSNYSYHANNHINSDGALSLCRAVLCTAAYRMLRIVECVAQAEWSMASGTVSNSSRQRRYRQLLRESNGRVTQTVMSAIADDRQLILEPLTTRGPAGHKILKLHDGQENARRTIYLYLDKGMIFYKVGRASVFRPARSVEEVFSQMHAND